MTLKDLESLFRVLRKHGITYYKDGDLELNMTEDLPQSRYKRKQDESQAEPELTEEQLLMWSSSGRQED